MGRKFLLYTTFTMIDGKVCNALISMKCAQQSCYLYGATSKDFNKINAVLQKKVDEMIWSLDCRHCMCGYVSLNAICICPINSALKNGKRVVWKKINDRRPIKDHSRLR